MVDGFSGVAARRLTRLREARRFRPVRSINHPPSTINPKFLVAIAAGKHPFPSRTRKLRPPAPMVLPLLSGGRVGRRQVNLEPAPGTPPAAGSLYLAHGLPFRSCQPREYCTAKRIASCNSWCVMV